MLDARIGDLGDHKREAVSTTDNKELGRTTITCNCLGIAATYFSPEQNPGLAN